MNIAIIDAEIIGKNKHRFPNLCSMKISAYHKQNGDNVQLKTDYENLQAFDKVYISKVFTKTQVPDTVLTMSNVVYGGTGFFYDNAQPLPQEIEHIMPDYHLYDDLVNEAISTNGENRNHYKYYLDYSIGYLTRKCFRGCYYCVNRKYKKVEVGSALSEFYDPTRPKICFLDDNFLGYPKWKELIEPVIATGKRFQFKQGLDERLLTRDTILEMSKRKYDSDMIFAFDNIEDKDLITKKLNLIKETVPDWKKQLKFYVFCGCDRNDRYDIDFWKRDIENLFERISILSKFGAKPYVMRFEKVYDSDFSSFYAAVASWCNQPHIFKTFSFRMYCMCHGMRRGGYKIYKRDIDAYLKEIGIKGSEWREMERIEAMFPDVAERYYDISGKDEK